MSWPGRRVLGRSLLLAALLAAAGCRGSDPVPEASSTPDVIAQTRAAPTTAAKALSVLGRADILAAAVAAADDVAAGNPLPQANLELVNRSFELRLPIVCGNGETGAWGSWRVDPSTNVLRVSFSRQNWEAQPLFAQLAKDLAYETAEGFWIERPWTRSEQCPPALANVARPDKTASHEATPAPAAEPAPEERLAIVQFFSSDAPRMLRRGKRPYAYTAKLPKDAQATDRAFRIKIEGRITGYADGQPVHCVITQAARPPVCAVAVEFDKVVLEDAKTGENLAEWRS